MGIGIGVYACEVLVIYTAGRGVSEKLREQRQPISTANFYGTRIGGRPIPCITDSGLAETKKGFSCFKNRFSCSVPAKGITKKTFSYMYSCQVIAQGPYR